MKKLIKFKKLKVLFGWLGSLLSVFAAVGAFVWLVRKVSILLRAIH